MLKNKRGFSFVEIVGVIGAILIFLGVLWLIAFNWESMPDIIKMVILAIGVFGSFGLGVFARHQEYEKIGRALLILGALLFVASVFLIAQIFSTSISIQGVAWLFALCWIGVILSAYALDSPENVFVGLVVFMTWFGTQFIAFAEISRDFPVGIFAIGLLGVGILLYGLNVWHRSGNHRFSRVYQFWSVFYFLAISYILSFQALLPMFWQNAITIEGGFLFTLLFAAFALIVLLSGVVVSFGKKKISQKEIFGFIGVVVVFVILLALTGLTTGTMGNCNIKGCYDFDNRNECVVAPSVLNCSWSGDDAQVVAEGEIARIPNSGYCKSDGGYNNALRETCGKYNNQKDSCLSNGVCRWSANFNPLSDMSFSVWAIWIIINLFFIGFILLMVGYGKYLEFEGIINLALAFFVLDIATRYIGFIVRWGRGYTALAILFIVGGVLLLLMGWGVSRWRKKLVKETHHEHEEVEHYEPKEDGYGS